MNNSCTYDFLNGETEVTEKTKISFYQRKVDGVKNPNTIFYCNLQPTLSHGLNVIFLFLFTH